MAWRTPVPNGQSSPVISAEHVFLTARDGDWLVTLCLDRKTGKQLWRRESVRAARPAAKTAPPAFAAPTPATDGSNVYAMFDEFGLVSYDADGVERWRRQLAPFNTPYGFGSSPVIEGQRLLLIVDCDNVQNATQVFNSARASSLNKASIAIAIVESFLPR